MSPLITGFGNTVKPTTNLTCKDKNITAYISGDGQKVSVQITDDITENVTEGSHIFHFYNQSHGISCKVNVLVIRNCEYYFIWHSLMTYYAFLSVAQLFMPVLTVYCKPVGRLKSSLCFDISSS